VGIFPNAASIRRLIGAVLMEQNEEWQLQHRYLPQHTMLDIGSGSAQKDRLPAP
jgi:transposase-like protein